MNDNEKEKLLKDLRTYLKAHTPKEKSPRRIPGVPILGAALSIDAIGARALRKGGLTSATKNALLQGIHQMLRPGFRALLFDLAKKKGFNHKTCGMSNPIV